MAFSEVVGEAGQARLTWPASPYATAYDILVIDDRGETLRTEPAEAERTTSSVLLEEPGRYCFRIRAVADDDEGLYSEEACADVLAGTPTPSPGPTTPATPPATPGGPGGGDGGAGGATEPQGWYALFGNVPVADQDSEVRAATMVVDLLTAGVPGVERLDSRQSELLADDGGGSWVVVKDGFATQAEAVAVCDQFLAVTGMCLPREGATP